MTDSEAVTGSEAVTTPAAAVRCPVRAWLCPVPSTWWNVRMSAPTSGHRRAALVDAGIGLVVTAVLLGGLARPGFPILRDWVATPGPPLSDAALGLGESAARAVPQDVAVVWASRALSAVGLPVWPLTGLLTAVFCVWLAVAAGALVRMVADVLPGLPGADMGAVPGSAPGAGQGPSAARATALRLPAVVLAVWNPFIVERLLQGHWSLLAGVAAVMTMPVLLARATGPLRVAGACAALAVAGLTPTGWVLAVVAAAVALACAGERDPHHLGSAPHRGASRSVAVVALTVTATVTALPWLLATALAGGAADGGAVAGSRGAATGVAAFAARAEPGIGTAGSVVALGGIWNSQAVPPSRATWWAAVALALLLVVWALAVPGLWRARRHPVVRATVPTAVTVWVLVALAATGPGIALLDALVGAVPGAGLLRDTQKFVALALPATVLAYGFAATYAATFATSALSSRRRPATDARAGGVVGPARAMGTAGVAVALTAVALAAVPDAPRALWDQLRPVTYGPGWAEVAAIVDGQPGDLLVLPAGSFRSTPLWAGGRAVLDPAPRLLDTRVLVPGDLVVGGATSGATQSGKTVSGEGDRARRATEALLRGGDPHVLADMGVRWVLDERTSAGPRGESATTLDDPTTTTKFTDSELALYELPRPEGTDWSTDTRAPATARAAVLAAHAAWLVTMAAALAVAVSRRRRDRTRH